METGRTLFWARRADIKSEVDLGVRTNGCGHTASL
jgi:hypothetical protein